MFISTSRLNKAIEVRLTTKKVKNSITKVNKTSYKYVEVIKRGVRLSGNGVGTMGPVYSYSLRYLYSDQTARHALPASLRRALDLTARLHLNFERDYYSCMCKKIESKKIVRKSTVSIASHTNFSNFEFVSKVATKSFVF